MDFSINFTPDESNVFGDYNHKVMRVQSSSLGE